MMSLHRVTALTFLGAALFIAGCGGTTLSDYESKEHKFKVKMPGTPQVKKQNALGIEQTIYAIDQGSRAYLVFHQVNPGDTKGLEQQMLEGAVMGIGTKGTVKSKNNITLDGKYPGVEVHVTNVGGKGVEVKDRIYIVGDKLYQVMVSGDSSFINSDTAKQFMDSFQVTP